MKIYFSPTSPFVRKCLVVAHEVGLADQMELLPSAAHPVNRDPAVVANNPLGQVPVLFTEDGQLEEASSFDEFARLSAEASPAIVGRSAAPEGRTSSGKFVVA